MAIMRLPLSRKSRLIAVICISFCFFIAELVGKSLALVADAFHYASDLIGFLVALVALLFSEREKAPAALSYGWHRANIVGGFFNGVFMLALGVSILLQSIDRFIAVESVDNPLLVLIIGSVGLCLNILSVLILDEHDHGHTHDHPHSHSHDHSHAHLAEEHGATELQTVTEHYEHKHISARSKSSGRDLGMLGVMVHVLGDAINNIGVMVAAVIIWRTTDERRFYADPAVSLFIAIMILATAWPVCHHTGHILLQGAPISVKLDDIRHDLEKIPGIESVHELHVWRLDQHKSIASVHVVVSDRSVSDFMEKAKTIGECLHEYGIHSATLQPELFRAPRPSSSSGVGSCRVLEPVGVTDTPSDEANTAKPVTVTTISRPTSPAGGSVSRSVAATARRLAMPPRCQLTCGTHCVEKTCCTRGGVKKQ